MRLVRTGADPRLAGGRLTIDLAAIVANWRDLAERSKPARCAAVVKADAYGLGAAEVVPALLEAGCNAFFVALPDEGVAIRRLSLTAEIFILNGVHAMSADTLTEAELIPVLNSLEQIEIWAKHCDTHGLNSPCAVMVDTGMNRLGLTVEEAMAFHARNARDHLVAPVLMMSHLACGDEPGHPLNRLQKESFQRVASLFSQTESSLANSAGIFLDAGYLHGLTRPGIALYGGPVRSAGKNPMRQVLTLEARIVQVRHARKGETVSYGAAHTLTRDTTIAAVSVGYADGYPRSGSGAGVPLRDAVPMGQHGFIGNTIVPLIGRVTMDLTLFDVTHVPEDALAAGWIELIGPNIPLEDAAKAAGTITYELLTGLGPRYERRYLNADEG